MTSKQTSYLSVGRLGEKVQEELFPIFHVFSDTNAESFRGEYTMRGEMSDAVFFRTINQKEHVGAVEPWQKTVTFPSPAGLSRLSGWHARRLDRGMPLPWNNGMPERSYWLSVGHYSRSLVGHCAVVEDAVRYCS